VFEPASLRGNATACNGADPRKNHCAAHTEVLFSYPSAYAVFRPRRPASPMELTANLLARVRCTAGGMLCILLLAACPVRAEGVPGDAGDVPAAGEASAEALEQERIEWSREVRRLHMEWVRARAKAAEQDPEVGRMEERAKALEAEAARVRAEMEDRLSRLPQLIQLRSELDAARERLQELGRQVRPARSATTRRVIRRKPDAVPAPAQKEGGDAAVEEHQRESGAAEAAAGSGE
jgi:hypothetical protein